VDALVVGVSFSLLGLSLFTTVAVIGSVTFVLCLPAVWLGRRLGERMARRAEILGGIALIAIGLKILVEHLSA
jgi:putative Mn2+ efflux pump MntP